MQCAPISGSDFSIFVKKRTDSVYLGIRNKANWSQTLNWDLHECRASKNEVYWSIISNYKMAFPTQEQGRILAAKVPRILAGSLEPSGEVLKKNHALLLQFWDITKNHVLLSRFYIRRMKYFRNILPKTEIFGKRLRATGRSFLSHGEISCHRKKFTVTSWARSAALGIQVKLDISWSA